MLFLHLVHIQIASLLSVKLGLIPTQAAGKLLLRTPWVPLVGSGECQHLNCYLPWEYHAQTACTFRSTGGVPGKFGRRTLARLLWCGASRSAAHLAAPGLLEEKWGLSTEGAVMAWQLLSLSAGFYFHTTSCGGWKP